MPEQTPAEKQPGQPGGGNADPGKTPEPTTPPSWLAEALADETKRGEFTKFARSLYDDDFKAHKEAAEKRERSLAGKVAGAGAWQRLTEEQQQEWLEEASDRDQAVEKAVADGVPRELLDDCPTAGKVRAFARKYIARHGEAKPAVKTEPDEAFMNKLTERLAERLGMKPPPPDKPMNFNGANVPPTPSEQEYINGRANGTIEADPKRDSALLKKWGVRL